MREPQCIVSLGASLIRYARVTEDRYGRPRISGYGFKTREEAEATYKPYIFSIPCAPVKPMPAIKYLLNIDKIIEDKEPE